MSNTKLRQFIVKVSVLGYFPLHIIQFNSGTRYHIIRVQSAKIRYGIVCSFLG